ncbi:hypothetical protein TRVL_05995 [Trypanosoma vivax]|nr:hypothetical protein TRVL_05995 [Trypanosoma vivax]
MRESHLPFHSFGLQNGATCSEKRYSSRKFVTVIFRFCSVRRRRRPANRPVARKKELFLLPLAPRERPDFSPSLLKRLVFLSSNTSADARRRQPAYLPHPLVGLFAKTSFVGTPRIVQFDPEILQRRSPRPFRDLRQSTAVCPRIERFLPVPAWLLRRAPAGVAASAACVV